MKKDIFIKEVVELVKENDTRVSQETVRSVLQAMEQVIDEVVKNRDSVSLFGLKVSTKEVAAKQGKINMGSRKGETWTTPAMIVPHVKFLDSKKKELSKEK